MLVLLGFFVAGFLALLIAPAYRRRAARLANEELKRTMPLSEAEIRADKDRLRADYAIYIHQLQEKVDEASDAAARQRIELNRRDAGISSLEGELVELRTQLEEHQNARRVLEQTIMDRLPKVEQRLQSAKHLLNQRDQEVARLTETGERQARALEEAEQINRQQRDETLRLEATLKTRSVRNRDKISDARFDSEIALRSEIEALRSKTKDQAALISRLQDGLVKAGGTVPDNDGQSDEIADEVARLNKDLAAAEAALRSVQSETGRDRDGQSKIEDELRRMKAAAQDDAAKTAELEAALSTYKSAEKDNKVLADSKMALKAQVMSLEAQSQKQAETVESLRAEIATANERLARQATHFMDEMRRLGSGTLPVGETPNRANAPTSVSGNKTADRPAKSQSLTDRINEPRNRTEGAMSFADRLAKSASTVTGTLSTVSDIVRPMAGKVDAANDEAQSKAKSAGTNGKSNGNDRSNDDDKASAVADASESKPKKPGLMDRITSLEKSKRSSKSA